MGFDVKSADVDGLYGSVSSYTKDVDTAVDELRKAIGALSEDVGFTGAAAMAVKSYFSEVHGDVVDALSQAAFDLRTECAQYVQEYDGKDSSSSFRFSDSTLDSAGGSATGFMNRGRSLSDSLAHVLGSIADIMSIGNPSVGALDSDLQSAQSEASDSSTKVAGIESRYSSVTNDLDSLESTLSTALDSVGTCAGGVSYVKGSFGSDKAGLGLASSLATAKKRHTGGVKLAEQMDKEIEKRGTQRGADVAAGVKAGFKKVKDPIGHALNGAWLGAMVGKAKRGTYEGRSLFSKGGVHAGDIKLFKNLKRVGESGVGELLKAEKKTGKAFSKAFDVGKNPHVVKLLSSLPSTKHGQVAHDLGMTEVGGAVNAIKDSKAFRAFGWVGSVINVGADVTKLKSEGFSNGQTAGLTATHLAVDAAASTAGEAGGKVIGAELGELAGGIVGGFLAPVGGSIAGAAAGAAIGSFLGGVAGGYAGQWVADKGINAGIDREVKHLDEK